MTPSPRLLTLVLVPLLCALTAVGGCAAPGGLSQGEPAAPMSAQPHPEALWPAWVGGSPQAPGAATGTRQAPPTRLEGAPAVGRGGLTAVNYLDVVRADKRMRQYVAKGRISAPGGAGIRPAVYLDVTGDGKKDLIVAADTESGRTALSVYTVRDDGIVPVLYLLGRRMAAEALDQDLLIRTAVDEGAEEAVRFHWDGWRMTAVSSERRWNRSLPGPGPGPDTRPSAPAQSPGPAATVAP